MKPPALRIGTLKKRREFLALRKGARISGRFFVVQFKKRQRVPPDAVGTAKDADLARFGLTVTRKCGNAVERNRIKRRLRAAILAIAPNRAMAGHDYVVFAHRATLQAEFTAIAAELTKSLDRARTFKEKAHKEQAGASRAQ